MRKKADFTKFKQLSKKQVKKVKGGTIIVDDLICVNDNDSSRNIIIEDLGQI